MAQPVYDCHVRVGTDKNEWLYDETQPDIKVIVATDNSLFVGIDIYLYFPWIYCQLDTDTMLFFCSVSFFYYCGYLLQGRWMGLLLLWTFVASVAFNVPLQNWLFHSADDIVRYASITDLYKEKDKPMYFTFDRLEVDNKRRSTIGIWREHTRRVSRQSYRTEKKQHWYSVSPVFEDSLPEHKYAEREVKAWVVAVKHDKQDSLVCYEWCTFDIGDYKKAIDKSRCKVQHSDAPIIKPLYKQFTTKSEWRNIFLNVGLLVFSIQVLIGVIMNYRLGKS